MFCIVSLSLFYFSLFQILSIFDIIRIIKCGPVLPGYLWRERLKTGTIVTPEAERDCKLICLVLSSEYYLFLLVGLSTVKVLLIPIFIFLTGTDKYKSLFILIKKLVLTFFFKNVHWILLSGTNSHVLFKALQMLNKKTY